MNKRNSHDNIRKLDTADQKVLLCNNNDNNDDDDDYDYDDDDGDITHTLMYHYYHCYYCIVWLKFCQQENVMGQKPHTRYDDNKHIA